MSEPRTNGIMLLQRKYVGLVLQSANRCAEYDPAEILFELRTVSLKMIRRPNPAAKKKARPFQHKSNSPAFRLTSARAAFWLLTSDSCLLVSLESATRDARGVAGEGPHVALGRVQSAAHLHGDSKLQIDLRLAIVTRPIGQAFAVGIAGGSEAIPGRAHQPREGPIDFFDSSGSGLQRVEHVREFRAVSRAHLQAGPDSGELIEISGLLPRGQRTR